MPMYKGGYWGKVLVVNLTEGAFREEDLPPEIAKNFIGGVGIGVKYLFDKVKAGTDPLGPDNKLIFAVGPYTGTAVPCANRMAVVSKSPLTGTIAASFAGGYFPVELKKAGYDALIVEGKADKPTYLWIRNGEFRLRDARSVWGTQTSDCQQIIKDELNDQNARVACIGPAGENLSKMACIINERRAAGRKGLGAVMGSKNLKAIAVRGTNTVRVASEDKFKATRSEMIKAMKESFVLYEAFAQAGTPLGVEHMSLMGIFPIKNWTATAELTIEETLGLKVQDSRKVGRTHCYGCPVGCSQLHLAKGTPYGGILAEGPEYETFYSFGGQTGVDNIDSIIAADRLADELGLDTISAGVAIGFAMELYEMGILAPAHTNGLELRFGNHEAMVKLLQMIAFREGLGDVLSDGVKVAAQRIGKGSEKYAMHVKGLELPAYDVRGAKAHGLNYATSYTGADHNRGYAFQEIMGIPIPFSANGLSVEKKGELTKWNQDAQTALCDCTAICSFILPMALMPIALSNTSALLEAVTGNTYTEDDILKVGERINNLARMFNAREGFTRKDDSLPERLMTEPMKGGPCDGSLISQKELDLMLDEYYTARGWDLETGIPTKEKLADLGLEYVTE
ncbi:aldehyde ferredoxin oxidoreductase family protein [Candidatus Poribacteria bacterium]|nr:aldehyde ferredoxin oxidoreductase family protein [Candidatus Poribacteria bacterium]